MWPSTCADPRRCQGNASPLYVGQEQREKERWGMFYQPEFKAILYFLKMNFVLKTSMISWSSKTQNNIHPSPHHLRAVPWSQISRFVGMLSLKSSALIATVTYAEHITWSRAINKVNFTLISWLKLSPHLVYQAVRQSASMFQSIQFKVSEIWRAASN